MVREERREYLGRRPTVFSLLAAPSMHRKGAEALFDHSMGRIKTAEGSVAQLKSASAQIWSDVMSAGFFHTLPRRTWPTSAVLTLSLPGLILTAAPSLAYPSSVAQSSLLAL